MAYCTLFGGKARIDAARLQYFNAIAELKKTVTSTASRK
jgi:hypothetical protein